MIRKQIRVRLHQIVNKLFNPYELQMVWHRRNEIPEENKTYLCLVENDSIPHPFNLVFVDYNCGWGANEVCFWCDFPTPEELAYTLFIGDEE